MNEGWISLHRKLLEWEWYGDYKVVSLFIHCLLKANYKTKEWRGNIIPRGTFITSYESLSNETGLSIREIRTSLSKLIKTGEIDKRTTNLNSWVTVINYDRYQEIDRQETSERQASDKRATTTNKENNYNNVNKETNKGDFSDFIPENLLAINGFEKTWADFVEHRRSIRKKMTKVAAERIWAKITKMNSSPIDVLNQSIENGWAGIFEIKQNQQSNKHTNGNYKTKGDRDVEILNNL